MKRNLIITGSVFFILFSIFTLLVKSDKLLQFDFDTTVRFQNYLSEHLRLTEFFCSLSLFGHFEIMFGLLLVIIFSYFSLGYFLHNRKNQNDKHKTSFSFKNLITRPNIAIALISSTFFFGAAHILELFGKLLLHQPNPPQFFIKCHNPIFPSGYVQPGFSYPSGHSFRVVFIAVLLSFLILRSKLNIAIKLLFLTPIGAITFFMLVSRISLGEHWATDVIGGTLLAISFSFFSLLFL